MRTVFIFVFSFLISRTCNADVVFFMENMGTTAGGTLSIAANTFQNTSPISFTGNSDTRTTSPSSGYAGASGNRNVFFTNTVGTQFTISGINTTEYIAGTIDLSFGSLKSTTASNYSEFVVSYSTNGTTFTNLPALSGPTGAGTATWRLFTLTDTNIPITSSLSLRWTNTSSTTQFRLDDVVLSGLTAVPEPNSSIFGVILGSIGSGYWLLRKRQKRQKPVELK